MRFLKATTLYSLTIATLALTACKKGNKPTLSNESQVEKQEAISAAFSQENDLSEFTHEITSLEAVFEKLGQALQEKDVSRINKIISGKQLAHYIIIKSKRKHTTTQKKKLINFLDTNFSKILSQFAIFFAYNETNILNIDKISGHELIVYTKQWDDSLETYFKCRWWLIKEDDKWKIYDLENLDAGSRLSTTFMLGMESHINKEPWMKAIMRLSQALQNLENADDIQNMDFSALSKDAKILLESNASGDIKIAGLLVYIQALLQNEKYDEAVNILEKHITEFKNHNVMQYFLALAYHGAGNYEKSIQHSNLYGDFMGFDSETYTLLSDSYFKLNKLKSAKRYALMGLKDNPRHAACVASYAVLLEKDQWQEILPMIANTKKETTAFEIVMDYLIAEDKMPYARFLFKKFKTKFPNNELIDYYEDELTEEQE